MTPDTAAKCPVYALPLSKFACNLRLRLDRPYPNLMFVALAGGLVLALADEVIEWPRRDGNSSELWVARLLWGHAPAMRNSLLFRR
jgi:hypothetical protein